MRILTCGFKSVGSLLFSDTARRVVVFGSKPYLEIHSLQSPDPPVTMDKAPPRGRRVAGYSDAEDRLRIVPVPGPGNSLEILSADGTLAVWPVSDRRTQVTQLHGYALRGQDWHPLWTATHPQPQGNGCFLAPRCFFDDNRRFLFYWLESYYDRNGPPRQKRLGVGDAADGRELTASRFFGEGVQIVCGIGAGVVVGVTEGKEDSDLVVKRLLIYPDGAVDGEPVERRQRGGFKALAADPHGRFLLSASGTRVTVWDPVTWKPARTFDWKIGRVTCLAVSADGTVAAAGGDKSKVAVWDIE